jgi:hypothetical protein
MEFSDSLLLPALLSFVGYCSDYPEQTDFPLFQNIQTGSVARPSAFQWVPWSRFRG